MSLNTERKRRAVTAWGNLPALPKPDGIIDSLDRIMFMGMPIRSYFTAIPDDPLREKIIEDARITLLKIQKINGFHFDVGKVSRNPEHFTTLRPEDFPAIQLTWADEDIESTGAQFQNNIKNLFLTVRGFVNEQDGLKRETDLNKFTQDIERVLAIDTSRNSLAIMTAPGRVRPFEGEDDYILFFDFEFTIGYNHLFGQP